MTENDTHTHGHEDKDGKLSNARILTIAAGVVIVVGLLAFMAGREFAARTGNAPTSPSEDQNTPEVIIPDGKGAFDEEEDMEGVEATALTSVSVAETLTIDWIAPEQQNALPLAFPLKGFFPGTGPGADVAAFPPVSFKLGTVQGGTYDAASLLLVSTGTGADTLGGMYQYFYVLAPKDGTKPFVVVDKYASAVEGAFSRPVANQTATAVLDLYGQGSARNIVLDTAVTIHELSEPVKEAFGGPGSQTFALQGLWHRRDYPIGDPKDGMTVPMVMGIQGEALTESLDQGNGFPHLFFEVRKDGRTAWYQLDTSEFGVWGKNTQEAKQGVPLVTWTDGSKATGTYTEKFMGGCGASLGPSVVDADTIGSLVAGGKSYNGSTVYVPASYETSYFRDRFNAWNYDGTHSFQDFVSLHPSFYMKDAVGRWIEFLNMDILPPAECGKPVIYLYPEQTTDLTVHLAPEGGFTKSEPAYGSGWNVTASPDGTLVNKADGLTYPYLFWEGRGGFYTEPTKFWVVERGNVRGFLTATLRQFGFNEQETADFLEFWEPRMQAAPYYKIGFHGTNVMNQIAPLSISQTPDTLIRVLMDYQELQAPIQENPPRLPSIPERTGFTVMEWGGVLR